MQRWRRDDGVALITALLAVVILGGMAVVFVARAVAEQRASGASQSFETVLHTAEAAADVQVAALNRSDDHVTIDNSSAEIIMPDEARATAGAEEAWARGLLAQMRGTEAWVSGDAGESYAVRPRSDVAPHDPLDVIYAVGATPGFDAPRASVRIVKIQVAQDNFLPDFALLTGGDLDFGGNASIVSPGCSSEPEACIADVHVNQDFSVSGSASLIEGQVRVAGGSCPTVNATGGCVEDGVLPQPVPEFTAADFYGRDLDTLNPDPTGQSVEWFDLCPDGTARELAANGVPCDGTQRWPDPTATGDTSNFRGWIWRANQNEWRGSTLQAGVFYVHHADASVRGSEGSEQRAVSILVSSDPSDPGGSGSLDISGNPRMQAALSDVLFITDRDLDMGGTGSGGTGEACGAEGASYSGLVAVNEQLSISGNAALRGAVIVRDIEDVHGLVTRNNDGVSGTMCLEYDDNLAVDLTGIWGVTFWNEL
jgi:hypothetical protein